MASGIDIWFPFYGGDYLSQTMHLTPQEHGAFLLVRIHQWANGHMDEGDLRAVTRLDADAWSIAGARLKHLLSIDEGGRYFIRSLDDQKNGWTEKRRKSTEKAAKAAKARWDRVRERKAKETSGDAPSIPQGTATDDAQAVHKPFPLPSPSSTPPSASLQGGGGASRFPADGTTPVTNQVPLEEEAKVHENTPVAPKRSRRVSKAELGAISRRNEISLAQGPPAVISSAMARRVEWLSREVRVFMCNMHGIDNPSDVDLAAVAWMDRDDVAVRDVLQAFKGSNEELRRCLEHRARSVHAGEYSGALQPSKWLRDLPSFLLGPINRHGDPLREQRRR
jgi:uncharacterized protein YdaU (DUF1376 family)